MPWSIGLIKEILLGGKKCAVTLSEDKTDGPR